MPTFERIIPLLVCRDIQAAHDFLVHAFGFDAGEVVRNAEGQAVHGEVRVGNTTIWLHRPTSEHQLNSPMAAEVSTSGLVVHVEDVDAHYERVRAAGADVETEPTDQEYGQREYGVRDYEGHRWWFATPVSVQGTKHS